MNAMVMASPATSSPATMLLMTVVMMVAMMIPSIAPSIWRLHSRLRVLGAVSAAAQTLLVLGGYVAVWTTISIALAVTAAAPAFAATLPAAAGAIVIGAGALQCSQWKADRLSRCRQPCAAPLPATAIAAWRYGSRLGVDCALSCAALTTILFVAGLMNTRAMLAVTAAITAERVAAPGLRIAKVTGALALLAGVVICVRA